MYNDLNINHVYQNKIFGFWIYLMSDCILFATFFAVFAVLKNNIAGGPDSKQIVNLTSGLFQTFCLLLSSNIFSLIFSYTNRINKKIISILLILSFILGLFFLFLEIQELNNLIIKGYGPSRSAFLSSFFSLLSLHGIHVIAGLMWTLVMIFKIYIFNLNIDNYISLRCLGLFLNFIDIIWICIFTIVYLLGVL